MVRYSLRDVVEKMHDAHSIPNSHGHECEESEVSLSRRLLALYEPGIKEEVDLS